MTISTANVDADSDSPLLARVQILAAFQLLNDLLTTADHTKAGALIPFDATITNYTTGSIAKALQLVYGLFIAADAAQAGALVPFDATIATYTAGSLARELRDMTHFKASVNAYSKSQSVASVALTDASTVAVDASLSNNFKLTLTATGHTVGNPSNLVDGQIVNLRVTNGGAYTLAFASKWFFAGGAPTITSGSGKIDLISGVYWGDIDKILCGVAQDQKV